ncbi:MAG: VanZ family protein [Calditerricola sp.]|nr:VanZ family protein [Calditerricola sp.]
MWRWLPAGVWMTVIFILSSRTSQDLQSWFPFFSSFNWGHFVAYFILAWTYYYALWPKRQTWNIKRWAVVLAIAYGVTDEIHQYFVPTRHPDVMDLLVDLCGALAAMWLAGRWEARRTISL